MGKTELVKQLASDLFDNVDSLIRLDMSEYMEKHTVSKLIGSPPGYVGYDEAGQLTEKIRRRPYSIVLFDEIEKAHPDVLNVLLQVLDDGRITDAQGRVVNFENTIIVMTSNAGSEGSVGGMGFGRSDGDKVKEKTMKALQGFLRPEFLNRVDEIITFNHLTEGKLPGHRGHHAQGAAREPFYPRPDPFLGRRSAPAAGEESLFRDLRREKSPPHHPEGAGRPDFRGDH